MSYNWKDDSHHNPRHQDDTIQISVSILISTSLFIGTTCIHYYLQHCRSRKQLEQVQQQQMKKGMDFFTDRIKQDTYTNINHNGKKDHSDDTDADDTSFRRLEWYRLRRMEDRMSFREVPTVHDTSSTIYLPIRTQSETLIDDNCHDDSEFIIHRRLSDSCVGIGRGNINHFEGYDNTHTQNDAYINYKHFRNMQQQQQQEQQPSNVFRQISVGSDSDDDVHLSKQLEGEDLVADQESQDESCSDRRRNDNSTDQCKSPHNEANVTNKKHVQHLLISPSITPPPPTYRSSLFPEEDTPVTTNMNNNTLTDIPIDERQQQHSAIEARFEALPPIYRSRSVPYPPRNVGEGMDLTQYSKFNNNNDYIQSNRIARTKYNASIMPNQLILIRHGQSLGNVDDKLYATTPDNAMPLTQLGWEQAKAAGIQLKEILEQRRCSSNLKDSSKIPSPTTPPIIHFIVSPYVRTVETFHGIVSAWCDPSEFDYIENYEQRLHAWYNKLMITHNISWNEDPRIREQDFGNYQEPQMIQQAKRDRHKFGAFYFRFPLGESASDVFDRVSTFLDSLWRSFDTNNARHYVLVTHGISIRVILARYFRYTIDQFHQLANPRNCEMVVLQHDGAGRLVLGGRYELDKKKDDAHDTSPMEYKYYPRLRVLPQDHVHKAKIRMKFGD